MIRVTQVLDYLTEPELMAWFLRTGKAACKKISDEALRVGSLVDKMIQEDIKGEGYLCPAEDTPVENCMSAWEKFKVAHPSYISLITGFQEELTDGEVVGHPDIILPDQIDDVKTSRAIQPRYWTQTGKYASMAKKSKIGIIRLDKETGNFEYKVMGQDVIDYELGVFNAYLTAYKHNTTIREIVRRQLELEVLNVP